MAARDEILDVPLSERLGPDGQPLPLLHTAVSWRLDHIPAHFERVRILKNIYGIPFSDTPRITAPPMACVIAKGLPTDRLVVQIVVDKFDFHLPLYRQETRLERLGLGISRATLMNWIAQAARVLEPIQKAIAASILQQPVLGLDDTYLAVLDPGAGKCHQGRLWGYLANEEFFCEYRATREGQWPAAFLADYRGTVLGDAYSGHHCLFTSGERTPAGCISHARRYFDGAAKLGEVIATKALDHFAALYAVEEQVAGCPPEEVLAARTATSVGILDKLEVLLNGWLATERPSSATWIATNYTLKIYVDFRTF
jgi:transposase